MPRDLWVGLILGLLIGLIAMWVVDWLYWRRRLRTLVDVNTLLESNGTTLRNANIQAERELKGQRSLYEQVVAKSDQLRNDHEQALALQATLRADNERIADETRSQLAMLHAEREQLGEEVRLLRQGGDQAERTILVLRGEIEQLKQELEAARGFESQLQVSLAERNTLSRDLAGLRAQSASADAERQGLMRELEELRMLRDHNVSNLEALHAQVRAMADHRDELQQELVGLRNQTLQVANKQAAPLSSDEGNDVDPDTDGKQLQVGSTQRNVLSDIDGIGPVYQQRLYDAGVLTFAQLAALSPQRVREIIKPQSWQDIKPQHWIDEAAEFAARIGRNA